MSEVLLEDSEGPVSVQKDPLEEGTDPYYISGCSFLSFSTSSGRLALAVDESGISSARYQLSPAQRAPTVPANR